MEAGRTYGETIQSIEKAARVLELFSPRQSRLTLSEMAALLAWNKPTTLRIANTLTKIGLLDQQREGRGHYFRLGLHLLQLASTVSATLDIRREAEPGLRRLAEVVGDTCYLLLRQGDQAVCVDRAPGSFIVQAIALKVGDRLPLNKGGAPLAILAHLPEDEQRSVLRSLGAPTDEWRRWQLRLRECRQVGYAVSRDEVHPETGAVGAPIFDLAGQVVAGISLGGPADRFGNDRIAMMVEMLVEAARAISARLGYVRPHLP